MCAGYAQFSPGQLGPVPVLVTSPPSLYKNHFSFPPSPWPYDFSLFTLHSLPQPGNWLIFFSLWLKNFAFTCLLSLSYYSSQILSSLVLFSCFLVGAFDVLAHLIMFYLSHLVTLDLVNSLQTLQWELEGKLQVSFTFSLYSIGQKSEEKSQLQ